MPNKKPKKDVEPMPQPSPQPANEQSGSSLFPSNAGKTEVSYKSGSTAIKATALALMAFVGMQF